MKKSFFLIILLSVGALHGFSQSKKNDLKLTVSALPLFGGSDNFNSGFNGVVIKPAVGYYITDKTSIELNFAYTTMNNIKVGNVSSSYNSYAFIPILRNNFINKKKLRIFTEFGFGLGTIKYDNFQNFRYDRLSGGISVLSIGVGGDYYFNDKFGIEFIIPYFRVSNITGENSNNLYSGVGPTIGLTYKLN